MFTHVNADPAACDPVFTPTAIKLAGGAFPFGWRCRFDQTADSHNCVSGIRRWALRRRSRGAVAPLEGPECQLDENRVIAALDKGGPGPKLVALTGQGTATGVKHPLRPIGEARPRGWMVLPDAATLAPTRKIDLSRIKPDVGGMSFYKRVVLQACRSTGWSATLVSLVRKPRKTCLARLASQDLPARACPRHPVPGPDRVRAAHPASVPVRGVPPGDRP